MRLELQSLLLWRQTASPHCAGRRCWLLQQCIGPLPYKRGSEGPFTRLAPLSALPTEEEAWIPACAAVTLTEVILSRNTFPPDRKRLLFFLFQEAHAHAVVQHALAH